MIDLETQLREYIDGIAEPIPSPAARAVVPEPVRRRRGAALVAAVVVIVLVVTIVAVALLARSDDAPTRIEPARKAPTAVPLKVQGTADCTEVRKPGDTLDLAVVVTGGMSVCITTLDGRHTVYADGRETLSGGPPAPNSETFGALGTTPDGRTIVFGYSWFGSEGVRMSFCDGTSIDIEPLTNAPPYWLGLAYDPATDDYPVSSPLHDGRAEKPSIGTCPPPSTVARGKAHSGELGHSVVIAGPADCSALAQVGDSVLLAVTDAKGHAICAIGRGNGAAEYFFDSRIVGGTNRLSGEPLGTEPNMHQLPLGDGRLFVFAPLLDRSDRLRLTFCDGRRLTLLALNDTPPRFAAGIVEDSGLIPSTLMLEGDRPAGFRSYRCPPPTDARVEKK
jgi:hypothetical protein